MDLSMLPAPVSEYDNQRAGARFTVRSANSLSCSPRVLEGERKSAEDVGRRERHRTNTDKDVTTTEGDHTVTGHQARTGPHCEKEDMPSTELNQDGTADKTLPVSGSDTIRKCNLASESQGRTHLRTFNRAGRSMSLDRRERASSPDRVFVLETKRGEDKRRTESEGPRSRAKPSIQAHNPAGTSDVQRSSPVSHLRQTLDRASKGKSLPSRLRSLSGSGPGASLGPEGGQSIVERIEKLFGSAGFGKTEDCFSATATSHHKETSAYASMWPQQMSYGAASGGTFPRRFSTGEKRSGSPQHSRKSITWTEKDTTCSEASPQTSKTGERRSGVQGQGPVQSRDSEVRGGNRGLEEVGGKRGLEEACTRSLDRATGRDSKAAQIRSARAAAGITAPTHSNSSVEKRPDLSGSTVGRAIGNGSKDQGEMKGETNGLQGTLREGTDWLEEQSEKNDQAGKEMTELKMSSSDEEVFDPGPQKVTKKSLQTNEVTASAASVRHKIHQFEALTQRAQGLAAGQALMSRRAFSVPTHFNRLYEGVKKSGSEKAIGGSKYRWKGLKEGGEADDESERSLGSNQSFEIGVIGVRSAREENRGKEMESNNICADFVKYSSLTTTLEIPLAQRKRTNFNKDEVDSHRTSSPLEQSERTPFSYPSDFTGVSPVIDDDLTPTNSPYISPILTPTTQPKSILPSAHSKNESTSVLKAAVEIPKQDPGPVPRPLASSSHGNLLDLTSRDFNTAHPHAKKRPLDLNAWVAGLKPDIVVWSDNEDDYEDDDDDDDDDSTQRDEDSNYDSDSGESSVTITSNASQSDRKSFCVSLADLRNFGGVDCESENDMDEWQPSDRRTTSLSSDMSAFSYVSVLPSEELDRLLEDVMGAGDTLQDCDDVQVVVLHKDVGVGLGFSVAGGVDQNKPVTIHKVFPSGVAAQEGSVREGDQVLSINGSALCGCTHWEALRVLRRAKAREMGVVVFRRGGTSGVCRRRAERNNPQQTQTLFNETGQHVCVRLEKNHWDLGFSLEGGVDSKLGNRPLTIQKIFQGGPVDKVRPGDEVEEIEGISVVGMRRLEAWTLIRGLPPGPVDVVLRRALKHLET
ncbi:aquaporin-10a isoform 1-T5 [Spinachia spinachia]